MWKVAAVCATLAAGAVAQEQPRLRVLRGELESWEGTPSSGHVAVRDDAAHVTICRFDIHSSFERDNQRVAPMAMRAGDHVEVMAERAPGSPGCYARSVQVVGADTWRRRRPSPTETFAPRGELTYAGVVIKVTPQGIDLRTRQDGERHILLRRDTRYIDRGITVEGKTLKVRTQVFIRAGRNLDDEIEAYQIVWGAIPSP